MCCNHGHTTDGDRLGRWRDRGLGKDAGGGWGRVQGLGLSEAWSLIYWWLWGSFNSLDTGTRKMTVQAIIGDGRNEIIPRPQKSPNRKAYLSCGEPSPDLQPALKPSHTKSGNVGAVKVRIGFWGYYTMTTIRNPQNPILIIKGPRLYPYDSPYSSSHWVLLLMI